MIRAFVDYSLRNRLLVLAVGILLLAWGAFSFKNLPVEAYPDVANNYVQVITQWPGRAGEEVEQQVTIPIEVQMSGIPHLANIRSISEFGLSVVTMNFDDESSDDWNRQKVLERLSAVTLPQNLQPNIGPDYSPVGQLYWYTLKSTNPQYDLMELKVSPGLGRHQRAENRTRCNRRIELRRHHARIPSANRSRQACVLRSRGRAGGTSALEQQCERRRELH